MIIYFDFLMEYIYPSYKYNPVYCCMEIIILVKLAWILEKYEICKVFPSMSVAFVATSIPHRFLNVPAYHFLRTSY